MITRLSLCTVATLLLGIAAFSGLASERTEVCAARSDEAQIQKNAAERTMKITVGSKSFQATLEDNPTVAELRKRLPLTLKMAELNGNEKYYHFTQPLPTDAVKPGTIRNGDLMLYGDNSLVLFYKTFETSYSYTRLGRIDDPAGLAEAVGADDISVSFAAR